MPLSILMNPVVGASYLALAILVGFFGRRRVFGFWGFFLLSLFLTPIIVGLALILAAPSPAERARQRERLLRMYGIR
jgi:hypothetical protein